MAVSAIAIVYAPSVFCLPRPPRGADVAAAAAVDGLQMPAPNVVAAAAGADVVVLDVVVVDDELAIVDSDQACSLLFALVADS